MKKKQLVASILLAMRITFLQLVIAATLTSSLYANRSEGQTILDKPVTISVENLAIHKVISKIEKQTGVEFIYSPNVIEAYRKISCSANEKKLGNFIDDYIRPLGIGYKILNDQILLFPIVDHRSSPKDSSEDLREQREYAETVTGTITNELGQPLVGVSITIKGSNLGTTTNSAGKFTLEVPDKSAVLVISYLGYISKEVSANQSVVTISLEPMEKMMQDVVIVGYGTVKRTDLTGSVSSVSSDKITQVKAISNVAHALQGQAAGVQVAQRSGQPGENVSIIIRGNNSIQASNSPLYVVDGLPLDGLSAQLNPSDIENIEILKDASSTAIYGSRGANGVIMITTKKGKEGKPKINYNGYFGVQSLRKKMDLINAQEFAMLQNEVAANDGTPAKWSQSQIDSLGGKGTDWQDLVYRNAIVQNHDVSVSGGNGGTKYYTSLGYFDQDGIIQNSGFKRYSFRTNLDQKFNDKFTANLSLSLQQSNYAQNNYFNADGNGGVPFTTMVIPPTQGVYQPDGKYTVFTGVPWGQTNPYGMSKEEQRADKSFRIIGNLGLTYTIIEGLKLRVNAGVDNTSGRFDYYAPRSLSLFVNGGAFKNYSNSFTFVNENYLNYNKRFGDHGLDVVAGFSIQESKFENLNSGTFQNFLTDIYGNNNLAAAGVRPTNTNSGFSDNKLISYLGRVNYTFADKYLLTLTGRYDGSSRFSANNKFAFFPSGAVGWRISEEGFMQNVKAVSNLKLRASYGVAGNQAIGNYQTLGQLSTTNITLNNAAFTTYFLSRLENNSLKWESTRQFDVGIDLGLFNERLQFTADYYNKRTVDLLLNVTLPPNTGFTSALQNVGVVGNKGFEFQLNAKVLTGKLKWNSTLTYSSNRTEVIDLGKDAYGKPITYKEVGTGGNWFPLFTGQSMQQLYGYKVIGVYQSDAEAVSNGEPTKKAGNYKFQDTDGNGIVDGSDRVILSNFQPKFTFGFNNSFSYSNFTLSFLIVGSVGNDIANEFRKYNITLNGNWVPSREAYENRWVAGKGTNMFDRPSANSGSDIRDYANSLWIENGSYVRVRDITLSYNFPAVVTNKLKLSGLELYVSGQNLITLTNYSGYDPESSWDQSGITPRVTGWDRGMYPSTKVITGGVRVNF
jgi:TonB-linked SusC/RagA family outer membrane protein